MKKYILIGDNVISNDGDEHYISPHRLCELYNLNPKECVFVRKNERAFLNGVSIGKNSVRVLRPRGDGNYNLDTPQPN